MLTIWTSIFGNLGKYFVLQLYFEIGTNIFSNLDKYFVLQFGCIKSIQANLPSDGLHKGWKLPITSFLMKTHCFNSYMGWEGVQVFLFFVLNHGFRNKFAKLRQMLQPGKNWKKLKKIFFLITALNFFQLSKKWHQLRQCRWWRCTQWRRQTGS